MRRFLLTLALILGLSAHAQAAITMGSIWKGYVNAGTSLTVNVTPPSGHLTLTFLYTYSSGASCPTITPPSGFTLQGSPTCVSSHTETFVYTHTAGSSDTSYTFTSSGTAYLNAIIYDLGGANTSAPIDAISSFTAMPSSTTIAAPGITTTQSGDELFSAFGNTQYAATANSISSGWTQVDENGGILQSNGYKSVATAGNVTGPSITYGTAPTLGQTVTVAVAPAPTPTPSPAPSLNAFGILHIGGPHVSMVVPLPGSVTVENIVPIHAYVATSTVAGAGYDPGPTVMQSVLYEAQFTWGDTGGEDATVRNTDCPSGASCHPVGYVDMMLADCGDTIERNWYSQAYGGTDEGQFTHLQGVSHTSANRYYWTTGGSCTSTGGTSGGTDDIPVNPANSTSNAWWLAHFFQASGYVNSDSHVWTMADDYSYIRRSSGQSSGTAYAQEDEYAQASGHGPSVWRGAQATQLNYMAPYKLVANSLGPGSGVYQGNNKCTASSCPVGSSGTYLDGIYNWTVDTADLCSSLSSNTQSLVHEKPFAYISGSTLIGEVYNTKIVENTDSQAWNNCPGQNIEWLNFTGISGSDSAPLRYVTKTMEGLAEPNGFNGSRASQQIVQWCYTQSVNVNTELCVMPEDFLVFTNPNGFGATVHPFQWGTTGSNGTDDSNGCQAGATPSTGGMVDVTIQATCGHDGTDSAGYNAGVQAREFSDCYQAGVDKGPCAVVLNTGTANVSTSYMSGALANWSSYKHLWSYSGTGPMNIDPITGGVICPSGSGCNGAIGTPAAIPASIPPCTWSNMVTSAVCGWILVSW